jgi:hypothetical protein
MSRAKRKKGLDGWTAARARNREILAESQISYSEVLRNGNEGAYGHQL